MHVMVAYGFIKGPFINYVTLKRGEGGGISSVTMYTLKHTPVWDNV